ncbi:hypothetical protein [Hyalangium rubrum]|uniref:Lipoprotein n=1 Tax=Hyalangium rubrum TaxID=3103134 RepID=A0ABU5GZQ5_9BACT|nr:hypothetical protein [Hyalangium sp. s54d21]MDY7226516.1 hypothetical protein [Hyalangium sp. s54d21]
MRSLMGAVLAVGLLVGCGGIEGEQDSKSDVEAMALCSDCHWLYVRCMSRAATPEAKQNCEFGRMDCEATWCTSPAAPGSGETQ